MPLPQTTGRAIAAYLRSERPATASRRVFVRHVAPLDEPMGPDVVRNTVRQAYRRCGLPYTRVHILRHTLASRLLETGGTLKEVADVLRHRALDTSLIYAKVDYRPAGGRGHAVAGERGMSRGEVMQTAVQRYLKERRRLGFAIDRSGHRADAVRPLRRRPGPRGPLTLELQLDWAREHVVRSRPVTAARRIEIVRPFAAYYRQFEVQTEVPTRHVLGRGHRRLDAAHLHRRGDRRTAAAAGRFAPRRRLATR